MRILFLLTCSLDGPSGGGRYLPLAQELAALGHKITILAMHYDLSKCRTPIYKLPTVGEQIEVRIIGQMHVRVRGGQKTYFPLWEMIMIVIKGFLGLLSVGFFIPADAIHIGKAQPANGIAGWLISRLRRIPLFLDCDDYEARSNRFSNPWQHKLVAIVENWLPRQTNGVTVNTSFLAKRCKKLGAPVDNIILVPNGIKHVSLSGEKSVSGYNAIKKELSIFEGPVIAYFGSLSLVSHPVGLLLESFEKIYQVNPQSCLLIVGGGPDENYLRKVATRESYGKNVIFTGQVQAAMVPEYYQLVDVTVDPVYLNDVAKARCPLKLMESLMFGRPIVTGDVGDRKDLLGPDFKAWIVEPGDANALATGILEVIKKKQQGEWPDSMIQQRAMKFDWKILARIWEKVYRDFF